MAIFTPEDVYADILLDLKEEITELYESSEQTLIELEITPTDNELQRSLFRSVHTIKGDLGLVGFAPMIAVLQALEDILDMFRNGEIQYSSAMSDLVLLLLDKVITFVDSCISKGQAKYNKKALENTLGIIKQFNARNSDVHESLFEQVIVAISGHAPAVAHKTSDEVKPSAHIELPITDVPTSIPSEQQTDLLFFRDLMRPIEKRAGYKEGRADKIAALALYINALHKSPINDAQLIVACYVHDFGMAFMPENVVKKTSSLTLGESLLLRSHVYKSARLLEHLTIWDEARKIVIQHHENMDGSGYPIGLIAGEICEGAKLLSIVDKYFTLLHKPNDQGELISEVDAIIALNKNYKGKLSGTWLRLFNEGMTLLLKTK